MQFSILFIMLTNEEGQTAVQYARHIIDSHLRHAKSRVYSLGKIFDQRLGVFVTLHTYPEQNLRGCIGIPQPIMSLKEAILESAQSATRDPRFTPLEAHELDKIIIEVTILTKPELITVTQPIEYLSQIEIGRDGLIVEQGYYKGLLLPQVPIEQHWEKEEFLSQTCMKAGLMPDAWFDKTTKIYKFSGQIFTEIKPHGQIKEKNLNGSNS